MERWKRRSVMKGEKMIEDLSDIWVCNNCGEEFVDDGSMMCPHCDSDDLIEAEVFREEMGEEEE